MSQPESDQPTPARAEASEGGDPWQDFRQDVYEALSEVLACDPATDDPPPCEACQEVFDAIQDAIDRVRMRTEQKFHQGTK